MIVGKERILCWLKSQRLERLSQMRWICKSGSANEDSSLSFQCPPETCPILTQGLEDSRTVCVERLDDDGK
jgi:hypothetical protein